MSIASAIVVYAVIWFLALFVALPIGLRTQDEEGEVTPGTPASAPSVHQLKRKFFWVTVAAFLIWAPICALIVWGGFTMKDIDIWGRM
jgi:predicted secreted protein